MARNSRKCRFAPCGNTVNLKNYPNGYCYIHQDIPNRRIKINGLSTAEYNSNVRRFKIPGSISRVQDLTRDITAMGSFPGGSARILVESYMSGDRGDITIPNVAKTINDNEIENTINDLASTGAWRKLDLVDAERGMSMNPDGTMSRRDSKKLIYGEENKTGARFLIDPRISTLSGGDPDTAVDDEYESGSTPFGDGIYAETITKFCGGSTMSWEGVVDSNGREIYSKPQLDRFAGSDNVNTMRKLIRDGAVYVPPKVDYSLMTGSKRRVVSRDEAARALSDSYTNESDYWDDEEYGDGFDFRAAERRAK